MEQIGSMQNYFIVVEIDDEVYYFVQFVGVLVVECLYEVIVWQFGEFIVYVGFYYYVYVFLME